MLQLKSWQERGGGGGSVYLKCCCHMAFVLLINRQMFAPRIGVRPWWSNKWFLNRNSCSMYFKAKFWRVACEMGILLSSSVCSLLHPLPVSFIKFKVTGGRPLPLQLLLFAGACLWFTGQEHMKACRVLQAELSFCEGAAMLSSGALCTLSDGGELHLQVKF